MVDGRDRPTSPGGGEHADVALRSRINDRQLAEWLLLHPLRRPEYWQRWLFLFVPCGIVPTLALFDWKRLDPPRPCPSGHHNRVFCGVLHVKTSLLRPVDGDAAASTLSLQVACRVIVASPGAASGCCRRSGSRTPIAAADGKACDGGPDSWVFNWTRVWGATSV